MLVGGNYFWAGLDSKRSWKLTAGLNEKGAGLREDVRRGPHVMRYPKVTSEELKEVSEIW